MTTSQKKVTSKKARRWIRTGIKPLSVNEAWQGTKVKTVKYRSYENYLLNTLPEDYEIPEGQLKILLIVKYSSRNSDIDNCLKPIIDVLQKKYGFNDNKIYDLHIKKRIVPKGQEEIVLAIESMGDNHETDK